MLHEVVFPEDLKKNNVVLIYKKDSKNLIKKYWPISALPVLSKVFERLVLNSKLLIHCHSDFIPSGLCVAQLIPAAEEIYKSFDCNPPTDISMIFLEIFVI